MNTLVVGDDFVPARLFREAIERGFGPGFGPLRELTWRPEDGDVQHAQHVMEQDGPDALATPRDVVDAAGEAEVMAVHLAPVSTAVLDAAGRLRAVVVARAGVENVDVEAARERAVAVVNVQGRNAPAVAEQTVGLMLAEARDLARADAAIKRGDWRTGFPGPMVELGGRTVGLIGFGHVARQLARRLSGFGVRLLVYDPYVDADTIDAHGGEKVADLATIFREGDYVSLHARLTEETRELVGREQLELMKPTAYFVNTARSRMVRMGDLYDVLAAGRIAGAAIDVHEDEPLPADSPWRSLDNVTLVPHLAGQTEETTGRSVRLVAEAIREIAEAEPG